jgi:hypothetical protein
MPKELPFKNEIMRSMVGASNTWREEAALAWDKALTEADATLANADICTPLEVLQKALLTKTAIEYMCAQAARRAEEAAAEFARTRAAEVERERAWQARLEAEPGLRREVQRREREVEMAKKFGCEKPKFGPFPPPPPPPLGAKPDADGQN